LTSLDHIPGGDYYLLGILSSWAIWFFISKTAQPLRLRGDRWQYRLIAQFMEEVPIPDAPEPERDAIANLARTCSSLGQETAPPHPTRVGMVHRPDGGLSRGEQNRTLFVVSKTGQQSHSAQ
jgi:hypothetical protein